MMLRLRRAVDKYVPGTASWHAARPGYWLLAYIYNSNSDGDGYIRYRPGELELIDAGEDPTEREIGKMETLFEVIPTIVYISAAVYVAEFLSGLSGVTITLALLFLALLTVNQLGELTLTVTPQEDVAGMEIEQ